MRDDSDTKSRPEIGPEYAALSRPVEGYNDMCDFTGPLV